MAVLDVEKESLEAHVDLCAERYKRMEEKLDSIDERMTKMDQVLVELRDAMYNDKTSRSKQMTTVGVGVIGALVSAVAFLTWQLILLN
ncbi:uncharacterized protein METZ01_LOCUS279083 [marine metagenome]|uniref:Uncharacterized protein n=1 Tax=marine metagenome TaxID=408172 RepID=A0A382KPN6_9ZZZZ|tara:strand:+ start:388 stop:651 length:264 start_codon:yes stop_codon:yes gene_type:complete